AAAAIRGPRKNQQYGNRPDHTPLSSIRLPHARNGNRSDGNGSWDTSGTKFDSLSAFLVLLVFSFVLLVFRSPVRFRERRPKSGQQIATWPPHFNNIQGVRNGCLGANRNSERHGKENRS